MEDAGLNDRSIGRIIPNPNPMVIEMDPVRSKSYIINQRGERVPKTQPALRVMKPAEYVVRREDVEIDGHTFRKIFVEYWLQRGRMEGSPNQLTFIPDGSPARKIGEGAGFEQKKAIFMASTNALATLNRIGLSKPIPQSYLCTATGPP